MVDHGISYKIPTAAQNHYYKWGYTCSTIGGQQPGTDFTLPILDYTVTDYSLPVQWESMQNLKITYKYFDDTDTDLVDKLQPVNSGSSSEEVTGAYNGTLTLKPLSSDLIKNTGYYFAGWKIENTGDDGTDKLRSF